MSQRPGSDRRREATLSMRREWAIIPAVVGLVFGARALLCSAGPLTGILRRKEATGSEAGERRGFANPAR